MNVFISGGCKNGKSMYAQNLAQEMARACEGNLYYLATMKPVDDEDLARIKRHLMERDGCGFMTIEQSTKICDCLNKSTYQDSIETPQPVDHSGIFLLDSVTALLSNEMFNADGTVDFEAPVRVAEQLKQFAEATGNTIFISDYIYADAMKYDELTEAYRKGLAWIDRTLAAVCNQVIEVNYGQLFFYDK